MTDLPPWKLGTMKAGFPNIQWDEPIQMTTLEVPDAVFFACRICIAQFGIKGYEISDLPTDPEIVREHIRTHH